MLLYLKRDKTMHFILSPKFQAPNSKSQIPKGTTPEWKGKIVIPVFFGIWSLGFGAWSFKRNAWFYTVCSITEIYVFYTVLI